MTLGDDGSGIDARNGLLIAADTPRLLDLLLA
jgi:hypothetical protein